MKISEQPAPDCVVEGKVHNFCLCAPACCPSGRIQRLQCCHSWANREELWIQGKRYLWFLSWKSLLCGRRTREVGLSHKHESYIQKIPTSRDGCHLFKGCWQVSVCSWVVFTDTQEYEIMLLVSPQVPVWLCILLLTVSRSEKSSLHPRTIKWQPELSRQTRTSAAGPHFEHARTTWGPFRGSKKRQHANFFQPTANLRWRHVNAAKILQYYIK